MGKAPNQEPDFSIQRLARGCERGKWQSVAKAQRALHGVGAEFSQLDRIALEGGRDLPVGIGLERDAIIQPGGKNQRRGLFPFLFFRRAQAVLPR